MKAVYSILFVVLLAWGHAHDQTHHMLATSINCFHTKDYKFWDLKPLMKDG